MPSMTDHILSIGNQYPDEIALTLNGKHQTYGQLITEIENAKKKCLALGLKSGDVAALVLPNVTETVVLFYALNALGIKIVMMHPLSSGSLIYDRCQMLDCKTIFIMDILEKRYERKLDDLHPILISSVHSASGISAFVLRMSQAFNRSRHKTFDQVEPHDQTYPIEYPKDAVILFSSGTSGIQKAIGLSNTAFNALSNQMESVIEPIRGLDSMFCVLPFFHGFGLGIGMHTVLSLGGRCILVPRLSRNTIVKTLLKEKPTYLAAVPYLLKVLLHDKRFASADLSFIRQVFVGGETVPLSLVREFNALLVKGGSKARVQVGYGCTETVTAVTLMDKQDSEKPGVGKPFRGNAIVVLRDDGRIASLNEPGEILISGPVLMNGYVHLEEENKRVLIERDGIRYYRSGDVGHLDEYGFLHFRHRKDDLIKVKGYLISPHQITECLLKVNGLQEAKIIVSDHDQLMAVLTVKPGYSLKTIKKEAIQSVKDLDGWCQPQRFVILKAMPVNEMRKIDMNALEEGIKNRSLEFLSEWSL